jgi:putative Mg2+ transporter-C (MgtC) family protein
MDLFNTETADIFVKLFIAMFCGMLIGTERLLANKTAGMRTYALVSMGSALFVVISVLISSQYQSTVNFDPLRMAAQIIAGVGFLGAGLILVKNNQITGLTSSTGLWVSAAIGMSAGFGLFIVTAISTFLTLFIFIVLWFIEKQIQKMPIVQDIERFTSGDNH